MQNKTLAQLQQELSLSETGARAAIDRYAILGDAESREGARAALTAHRALISTLQTQLAGLGTTISRSDAAIEGSWATARALQKRVGS